MVEGRSRAGVGALRVRERYIGVELQGLQVSRDGRRVLRDIDLAIRPGQRWLLLGHNGAGKTLLMKLLAGDVWPNAGRRCYVQGARRFEHPYGVKDQVAYVGAERQDRYERYRWNYRVEQIVATGLHRTDIVLDPVEAPDRARIGALLADLGLAALARRRFLSLSYGERRLVLLARALAWAPKLLLLDELLSGLDGTNRAGALRCLAALSGTRLPWVLSSHRPEELPGLITHVCEIDSGRIVRCQALTPGRGPPRSALRGARRHPHGAAAPAPPAQLLERRSQRAATPLIELQSASVWRDGTAVLRRLSLQVHRGECWVVHGANGSGKSTLLAALYGDLSVASGGRIRRAGVAPGVPLEQFRRRVGLVAAELQAAYPRELRVAEAVAGGLRAALSSAGAARSRRVRRALVRVGAAGLARRPLRSLSYGQLRRALFARALVGDPALLLLDEPYAGLDVATRGRLQRVVDQAVQTGVTVLVATHHRDEWPGAVTHELQLVNGRAAYCGPLRTSTRGSNRA